MRSTSLIALRRVSTGLTALPRVYDITDCLLPVWTPIQRSIVVPARRRICEVQKGKASVRAFKTLQVDDAVSEAIWLYLVSLGLHTSLLFHTGNSCLDLHLMRIPVCSVLQKLHAHVWRRADLKWFATVDAAAIGPALHGFASRAE